MSHLSNDLLYRSCTSGDLDSIKHYIITEKYDVNAENYHGYSPLCVSCQLGHLDIVQFLLTIPECDVNFKCPFTGDTPLHIAYRKGHEAIVQELLKSKKCDLNCKSYQNGDTPLHAAIRTGSRKCVTLLLANTSCDPNVVNSEGDTPLHIACQMGSAEIIDLLLSSERLSLYLKNAEGKLPLHVVSLEAIKCLIPRGHYSLNEQDNDGNTVLHIAVQTQCTKCVALLLTITSCDPNIVNSEGDTPLHIACRMESAEIIDLLLSSERLDLYVNNPKGKLPLHAVVSPGAIKCLIKSGHYNLNEQDSDGNTVLHIAIQTQRIECVALLVTNTSCDPNIVNSEGDTPLHIACQVGSLEIMNLLLGSENIDLHVTNAHGKTPLHILFQMKSFALIIALLQKGCSPSYVNREQMFQEAFNLVQVCEIGSLLHLACLYGSIGIVEFFFDRSYCTVDNVNKPNVDGDTPLHIAVRRKMVSIVEMLLTFHSVDPNAENAHGETALIAACSNNCFECAKILAAFEVCDLNKQNSAGNTALHVAVQHGNSEFINVLLCNGSCDPNISNLEENTPLHLAVRTKSSKCVAALLANTSCDPNELNSDVDTPLHIACQQGSVEIIDLLLSSERLDFYVRNAEGRLPLHATNLETIKYFLNSGHYSLNEQDDEGNTVLHMTVQINATECVAALLTSASCDPNKGNCEGDTPLHIACQQGLVEITDVLLSFEKLDLSPANAQGATPLQIAFQKKHFRLIFKFLEKSCNHCLKREQILQEAVDLAQKYTIVSLLHLACTYGSTAIIELFLCSPYSTVEAVNEPDMNGNTPLHIATRMGHKEIVQLLTKTSQCNPNILNCRGETPLHIAIELDPSFCISKLLLHKCDPNIVNSEGETPLYIACKRRKIRIIEMLLKFDQCNPNISTHQGMTALHIAIGGTDVHAKIVSLLLVWGSSCDPNISNLDGDTPLHIASRMGHKKIVQLITKTSQCNPNILNHRGESPLHIAIESDPSFSIGKLLLQTKIKCDPNIVNSERETPLYIACKRRKIRIIKILLKSDQCNPNISTHQGMTALHIAIGDTDAHANIVMLLLANTVYGSSCDPNIANLDGDTALHLAVRSKSNKCVKLLLTSTLCDPNVINSEGDTPLHIACQQGSVETIDILLSSEKVGLHAANVQGMTPLHIMFQNRNLVFKLLKESCNLLYPNEGQILQEVVDRAQKNGIGSLLHLACTYGSTAIIKLFLSSSHCTIEAVNEPDMNGNTPLHIATRTACHDYQNGPLHVAYKKTNLECVKLLLTDEQCNVDIQNKTGDTALHIAVQEEQISIAKYLIKDVCCNPAIANADGNTPLHIACNRGAWMAQSGVLTIVRLLLSTGKVDPECVNNAGRTPVELARGNSQIIKELTSFVETKLNHRIQSYIKLFFMGNAYAGKSTLVQAICTEASKLRKLALFSSQYKQVTDVEPLTAGIVPSSFCSKHFGNAILYDFAGQHEYYSSHAAVLENLVLSSPPIFLLVFNLSQSTDHIREELAYWWSFIDSHCKKTSITPHVILIGSHKDLVKSRGNDVKKMMEQIIKNMREIPATFHVAGYVALDCRSLVSNGLSDLLALLKDTCQKLRESVDVNIDLRCHILNAFLTDKFQHRVACTASEVQGAIKTDNTVLPQNPTDLQKVLSTLSDTGHILFLHNSSQGFEDSWIVLQRQALLTEVNGSIFAPTNFRQHIKDLAQVTGVVPLSKIKQRFQSSFNSPTPELVIVYSLTHLEFCFKIEDYHTLDIIASDSKTQAIAQEDEQYYFFPALVQVETPINVWEPNPRMTFQCGWFYECIHPYQFLTTRFLHVLILRLAFSFALAVDHTSSKECPAIRRRCSMWKHGIAWWNDDGIETIVEVGLQRHWVVVMMRCAEDQQMECVQHRTAVIKSILDTKDEFCPTILMSESVISPSSIQYPFQKENGEALYSLKDVAKTLIKGKPCVTHDKYKTIRLVELLPFEPYIGLSKEILVKLFSDEYLEKQVTDHDLIQIAEKSYHNLQLLKAAVKPNPMTWQRCHEKAGSNEALLCAYLLQVFRDRGSKTFKEFQTQLSKFSIFCGRNPLDIAEVKCSAILDTAHNSNSAHVLSTDSPQVAASTQPSSAATGSESSPLQQSTEEVDSTPLAPLPSSSPSLLSTNSIHVPADPAMQLQPNSVATTEYGEADSIPSALQPSSLPSVLSSENNEMADNVQLYSEATTFQAEGSLLEQLTDSEFEKLDNTPLGITDLYMVNNSLVGVVLKWQDLGLHLGLSPPTMEVIEAKHPRDTSRCMTETLAAWLQGHGKTIPTWRALLTGLKSLSINRDITDKIAREHGVHDASSADSKEQTHQDVDSSQLVIESLVDVLGKVLNVHNWFHLGLALGLSYDRLKGIEADNPQSIECCRTEALKAWLRKQDMVSKRGQPSWRTLAQALSSPLVGKSDFEVANMFTKYTAQSR